MAQINQEINCARNWSYKPYVQASNDAFVRQSFKQMNCKKPIMNYLKHSISLLQNCSTHEVVSKQDEGSQRRPLPLHKRPNLILRDIINVETKDEYDTGKNSDDASSGSQSNTDHDINAIREATKISIEQLQLGVKPDLAPIVIPSVPILSSDGESDCESVSIVAFDLENTNLEENEEEISYHEESIETPKPTLTLSSCEFNIPTEKTKMNRSITESSTFRPKNVQLRLDVICSPPVIKGKLGLAKHPYSADKLRCTPTVTSVVNFDGTGFERIHCDSPYSERMLSTCDYFNRLEAKQKYMKAKKDKREEISCTSNSIHTLTESINEMKRSTCAESIVHGSDGADRENIPLDERSGKKATTYNLNEKNDSSHFSNANFKENMRYETKTNVNETYCEANVKSIKTPNNNTRFFIQYLSGNEMYSKKLIPKKCDIILDSALPDRDKAPVNVPVISRKKTINCEKTTSSADPTKRKKKIRKLTSAPVRTSNLKKDDPVVAKKSNKDCKLQRNESPAKNNDISEKTICTKAVNKSIPAVKIFSLSKKLGPRRNKNSFSMNKPMVTMVSLSNSNLTNEKKSERSKKNSVTFEASTLNRPSSRRTIYDESKVAGVKTLKPVKIIHLPDEHTNNRKHLVPHKARRRYSASGTSVNDQFQYNEYRDIQNKLKEDNINVSMKMIKNVLHKPAEKKSDDIIPEFRLGRLTPN